MPVHLNGAAGYLWLSFGITHPLTLHWAALPLKLCTDVPDLQTWMQNRELMYALVKHHLLRAQARMKRQADMGRSECTFAVGDMVFLKLQPYV